MEVLNIKDFPDMEILHQILSIHEQIFKDSDQLIEKAQGKQHLLFTVALEEQTVTGYKIGYELNAGTFYSWLGGVGAVHRNKGIASHLMKEQHRYVKEKGYDTIQTKTKNKWREMLILNIRQGFTITGTETDRNGELKILLEKNLAVREE